MKSNRLILCLVGVCAAAPTLSSFGRGFGGSHGGFGGAAMGSGGFHAGGYGGGFNGGGFRGGMGSSEIHAYGGGMGGGEIHAYSGGLNAGGFSSGFGGGLRSSGGLPGPASFRPSGATTGHFQGQGSLFASQFAGRAESTPDTTRAANISLPTDMGMRSTEGAGLEFSGSARGLSSSQLSDADISRSFASLSDSIAASERRGAAMADADGRSNQSSRVNQTEPQKSLPSRPDASTGVGRSAAATRATSVNDAGANVRAGRGSLTRHLSPADLHVLGNRIRHDYVNPNDSEWYNAFGGVVLGAATGAFSPWTPATWSNVNGWFGSTWPANSYDYGDELTYDNSGNVAYNGQPIATAAQYWQSAKDLAAQGQQAPPKDAQWMPLGVFAAVRSDDGSTNMMFQLMVDKDATVRGSYFNKSDNNTQPIEGAVDKKTQRITWLVADRKDILFDTGLYNLTKDETTLLVHFGKDKTEQWTLVRLKDPKGQNTKGN